MMAGNWITGLDYMDFGRYTVRKIKRLYKENMKNAVKKTVFVIGAGFSVLGGIPSQNNLLGEIDKFNNKKTSSDWEKVTKFFKKNLGKSIENYLIEDLFTILDKCQIDDEVFKYAQMRDINDIHISLLKSIRDFFNNLVVSTFKAADKKLPYSDFASSLIAARKTFGTVDRISVITMNWDCLLEFAFLQRATNAADPVIDYCVYDNYFSPKRTIASINLKASGKMNFKILKLHGSTNWGICPNCGRLYISYGKKMLQEDESKKNVSTAINYTKNSLFLLS